MPGGSMREGCRFSKRCIAVVVAIGLALSGTPAPAAPVPSQMTSPVSDTGPTNPSEIRIPKELGSVKEVFGGHTGQTVIILQDAHGIPDAQRKIHHLIGYLTREYRIPLVTLEGASAPLDPFLIKTFPDRQLLEKVLGEYFDRGELAGGTASAILDNFRGEGGSSAGTAKFVGIEDWDLYQEGLGYFLDAMDKDKEISAVLSNQRERIQKEKEIVYSPGLLEADRAIRSFHAENSDLIGLLKKLAVQKPPPKNSELHLLLETSRDSGKQEPGVHAEIKKITAAVEKTLTRVSSEESASDLQSLHRLYQEYQTSRMSPEAFALFLKETVIKYRIKIGVSKRLSRLAGRQKRLRDIEGTKLFDALGDYERTVKESLFKSDRERRLDAESGRLDLIEKLQMLELSTKEWGELEKQIRDAGSRMQEGKKPAGELWSMDYGLSAAFAPHLAFYGNAQRREAALFSNLTARLNQSAVVVAGGFHAEGFKSLFEAAGISYALVMPAIDAIPREINYRKHMRGDVSWSKYFEVKDGKVSLYDAFVRGMREQLLKAALMVPGTAGTGSANLSRNVPGTILKHWRDEILRGLAGKGRMAESSRYTRFIDEITESKKLEVGSPERRAEELEARLQVPRGTRSGSNSKFQTPNLIEQWRANIDRFIRGLRDLKAKNQISEQKIAQLLQPNLMADPGAAAPLAGGELRADLLRLSPVRGLSSQNVAVETETPAVEKPVRNIGQKTSGGLPESARAVSGPVSNQMGPAESAALFARKEIRADLKTGAVTEFYRPAESPEALRGPTLISDVQGENLGWVLFYDTKKDVFLKEMILKLDRDTTAVIFVRDAILKKEIQDWLSKNKPHQKAIFYVANVHLSSWARDRLLFVRTKEGLKIVLPKIPESVEQTLRLNTLQAVRHFAQSAGIPVTESELIFEGGNILFNGETILVGRNMIEDNARIQKWDRAKIKSELIEIFGPDKPVLEVDDPLNYHLDMSLTLLPDKTVVLGDPALGLTVLLNDDPKRVAKFYEEENRRKKEYGHEFETSLRRTKSLTKKNQPGIERLAASLEAQGFTVRRVPLVLGYAFGDKTSPAISYNNVIFEGRRVFLPQFGLISDQKARKMFEELGYEVVPLDQAVISMTELGCVRCASQKVSAETPKVFESWAAALKALEAVSTPEAAGVWVWVHAGEAASSWLQESAMTTPTKIFNGLRLMYSWRDRKASLASKIGQVPGFLRQRFWTVVYSDRRWKALGDTWAGLRDIFVAGARRNFNATLEDSLVIFSKSEAAFDLFLSLLGRRENADLLRYYLESPPSLTQLAEVCDILAPYTRHIRVMEGFYNDPSSTSEEMHVFLGKILEKLSPATRSEMRAEETGVQPAGPLPAQTLERLARLKRDARALLGKKEDRAGLEKLYGNGLDGVELGEGLRLQKYGLGFLMKKQDKTVALGQLMFIPREGGAAVEIGRESFEARQGYGSRFIEAVRRAVPEEVMMIQTVTNHETLEALTQRLPEEERRQVEVVREAWVRMQREEAEKSVPRVVKESVKRAWMRALAEVYSKNGDLIPDAGFLASTVLGKGALIYGDDIRLVVNGKWLEMRTRLRQKAGGESPPVRSEMRRQTGRLPAFEAKDYSERFELNLGIEIMRTVTAKATSANTLRELNLDGVPTPVLIMIDERLLTAGLTAVRIRNILEKGYTALTPDQKEIFKEKFLQSSKPAGTVLGLITRENNKWRSRQIAESLEGAQGEPSLLGINEFALESEMGDALWGAQLLGAVLGLDDVQSGQVYQRLGGRDSFDEAVRSWNFRIEQKRYNVNQIRADIFIEGNRERYRFISGDQEEFPEVYRALRKIADDILAAAGYDPSHFRFHLSDYREGNAFVIHFANHIVVNLGFLWDTLVPILGDHPSPAQLKDYLQDHLAYVIGHEVGHLRQYRNEINRGDVPKPETVDEMHEKMKKGDMDLMKGKLEQHVEIYAGEVDADNFAVELMDRAGYNVREAHRAFQLLIEARIRRELGLKGSEKAARKIARFKSDHPLLEERVKNIRRTVMSKISRSEYEPVKRFAPGVFDELLAWREDGQYAFRRTRMRDFHRRVLAVTTLEELEEVVGDARDMKELEMASTYGVYALLFHRADPACRGKQGAAFSAFADYQRKMTGQVKRRLAAYKKAAAEIGVKVRDTYFAASAVIEPNYFDARCDLDLSPKISVPGGERAEPETLMALFLRTALSGEHVSLRAVLSGYSEYGLNDEQKEALRKLNEEAERLINEDLKDAVSQTQLNAVLDEIAHEARVSEVLDLVRQKTQSKSAKLTLSLTALPEFVQRYHSLSAVQSFYGANVGVSEDITGLKHREEAEAIRGKFRTLPKGEFAGFLGHLAASTWTPDIDPKDTDAGPPNAFLEEMNPSNGERTHAFFNSSDQLASLYEKVLDERVAEFSTQELLDYLPAFANFRKMLSEKFRGLNRIASEAESRFGMRLLFEIIRRLDEAPQLATSEVLSRLMEFWNNYPELLVLDYPAKEAHIFHARIGNFLLRHFILDGSHYEQFRAELFVLLAKTQGRIPCYFGPVPEGENRAPYVETRRVTEYLMERFENGELEDLPHFSARSQHGNRAEDVFMEWYRLTNAFRNGQYPLEEGVLALESFRLRMAETVMRKFGIRTVAQKLEFYERLLARTEGKEKQPLFFKPALAGFNHELDPLSYFCFEQAGLLLSGSVSFWQIRGLYEEDIYGGRDSYRGRGYRYSDPENSDESGEKRFIRALNVFEEIPGQPQVYRFKAGIREEDLTDERLRGLFRDLQIAARDTTGEDHIHQVLAAAHAQSGLAFDPNSHEEVRRLMYLFHAGGLLSIERFYEIVLNGIDPERTDRWTLRDLRALFVFLNALTPEQNKRSLSAGNEFSPANWPQYLTALSLFLIQEEFGFRLPGEVSFHEGLVNAPQNPYQIFFGDLPYDNSFVWDMKTLLADKALEALFRDYPRTLHDRAITSAQNGRTRSVDRFHMTSLKPEQLSQVFGFMESRPEWGFREWVDYARQYMPATVTRNLFLYYVFWKMKIAPAPAAGRSGDARFYDWTFTANTVSRLAGGDDSLGSDLRESASALAPLLVHDPLIVAVNFAGTKALVFKFAQAVKNDGYVAAPFVMKRVLVGLRLIGWGIFEVFVLFLRGFYGFFALLAAIIPSAVLEPVLKVLNLGLARLIPDNVPGKIFATAMSATSDPGNLLRLLGIFHASQRMIWYGKFRQSGLIRLVLSGFFSGLRFFSAAVLRRPWIRWEFNEPGNIHSQSADMVNYPMRGPMLKTAADVSQLWAQRFSAIREVFPLKSPVRDEMLKALAESVLSDGGLTDPQKLEALRAIYPEIAQVFFRDHFALQALEIDLTLRGDMPFREALRLIVGERTPDGKLALDASGKPVSPGYFPEFSFTRDDLLFELLEKSRDPEDLKMAKGFILQFQENVLQEEVRKHVFAENKIREAIQQSSNSDKKEFALWIMGLRKTKPFMIKEVEFLYGIDLSYLRDVFNTKAVPHFPQVGTSLKRDLIDGLFGGPDGLLKDPGHFRSFLNRVFDKNVPWGTKNRGKLRKIFMTVFKHIPDEKKLEILSALSAKIRAGEKTDPAELTRVFFESFGLLGIKAGQIISHSDMTIEASLRDALKSLSSSADPQGKKNVLQFMELIFGDQFDAHFQGVLRRLGSASIKVVYEMLTAEGEHVVLKLKRPQIDKVIDEELKVFDDILQDLRRQGLKIPEGLGKQIGRYVREEVDFAVERSNRDRFDRMLKSRGRDLVLTQGPQRRKVELTTPKGRPELDALIPESLRNVAIFEEMVTGGIDLNNTERLGAELGLTPGEIEGLKKMVFDDLLDQMFIDGFFHADPHGGNILVRKKGDTGDLEIVFIDLGSTGSNDLEVRAADLARLPAADLSAVTVNGKPFFVRLPEGGEETASLNLSITAEDFEREPESPIKNTLEAMWKESRASWETRRRQLAEWLMYMGLNKGKAPPIPEDKFLEATFFKKIPYLLEAEGVDEFTIAKSIFAKLGLTFPPDDDRAKQIMAVRLASRGDWARIEAGDFSPTLRERAESKAMDALARLRGRSEMRGESVPTSLEKVAASTEAVRRFYGYVKEKAFVPPASLHLGMRQHTLRDDGRTFELIEGGHGHPGISEAMVRLSERVFSDPGDWMIYFEGGEDLRQGFDHAMKTAQYAEQKTMAKILLECEKHYGEKLPVINTLPTGREPEVLEGIQGQVHLSREEVLTAQFYELFGVLLIEGMRQRATVRQAVETFLKNTRTDHEDPLRLLVDHARKIAGSETEYEAMAGRMTQVMQAGIMVRNAIAREKMATELAKYPGRKNVLAYVGTYHAGVFGLPEKEVKDRSPDIVKFVVSNLQAGGYLRAGEQPGFRAEARRAAESKVRLPQRRAEMRGEAGQGKPVRLSLRDMSSDILDLISELKAEVTTAVRAGFLTKVAKVYPDSSDGRRKILYPGSGGDALTFFLATDATDGYFVTLEKASGSQLKNALKELEYSRGHFQYLSQRRRKGVQTFASSQWLQQFPNILMLIVPELFALGVRDMDIRDHGGGKIELRFDWRHPNDPAPKPRTLTLLSSTNLKRQNTYMDTLPPDLDGVFSKAIGGAGAIGDAKNSFSPDFEGAIAKKLSPDAVIVTDHPANWVVRLGNDVNLFNPKGFGKKGKSAPQNLNFGHHRIAFLKRQTALPMSDDEKLDLLFDDLEFKTTPWFHPGFGEFFLEQLRKNPEVLMSLKSRLQGLVNRMGSNVGKNREVIDALVKYSALIGRVGPRFKRKEAQAVLVMLNSLSDRVANHRVYPGDLIVLKMYLLVAQAKIVQDVLKNNKKRDSLMKEARNLTELDILAEPWAAQKLLKDLTSFYGVGRSEIRREAERAERLSGTRPEADASGTSKHIGTGRSDMRDQERAEIRRETERAERLSGTRDQERAEIRRGEEPVASGTESERRGPKKKTIYEYLGVKPWRKAVWSQLAPFPYFSNTQGLRGQALLDTLKAFVDFTRQKERYHLVAIAAWIFLWGFVFYGLPPFLGVQPMPWFVKIAMGIHGVFMVLVDVYPVFLQRHNRLKAERIIRKLIQRGEDKPADPARIRKAVDTALKNDTTYRRNLDYEKYGDRPLATGYQAYRIVSADERGPGESPEDFLKRQFDRLVMGGRLVITATNNEELENFRHLLFELAGATGADLESFRIADDPKRLEAVRGEAYFMILEKKSPFWFSQDGVLEPESPVSKMGLKEAPQKLSESMPSVADMEPIETFLRERLTPDAQPLLDRFMDRVWFSISHSRIPANEQGFWFKRFFENILPWDGEELEKYLREVNLFFDETISLFGDDKQTALQLPRVLRLLEWFLAFVTRFSIYRSEGSSVSDATRLIRQLRSLWARIAFFAGEADRIRTLRETLPVLVNLVMQMRSEPNRGASLADDNNWFGLQSLLMAPEITFGGISYKKTHVYPPHYDSDHAFAEGKNPIFQMELVNPQDGKRIYVLAKRIGRATGYDEIYQASAKKLGLSSYEVETYREPHGMPMILIEYVPADLIAATVEKQDQGVVHLKGAPTEFNTSGIKNFLTGAEADVVRRLRELGGHLALEDLLGARDSTMKHFLFSKEEPRRIVKIDTEYLLDFEGAWKRNIPGPLQPESDVISFLRAIGEGPNGKVWLQAVEDGFNEIKTKAQANADALEEIILSRNGRVTPADLAPMRERLTRTFQQLRQSYTAPTTRAEMRGDLPGAALELADALNEYSKGVRDVSPYLPLHDLLGNESGEHLHGLLGGLLADIPNLSDPDQPDELAKDVYQSVKELNRALKTSTNVMIVFFKAESGAAVMEKKLPETAHFVVVDRREIERHIRELGMNSQGRAERILVAEDDEKLMKTYQSWADFIKTTELGEFDVVENGKKGLEKLRESEKLQKRTDLILSDVDMPEMDGIGMVESYRRESKGPAVPVVWVTGRGRNELGEAKDWVRTSYVGKPSFWHKTLLDEHFALLTGILMALDEREGGLGQQRESRSELRASEALAETRLAKTKGEIFRSFDAGNRVVIQVREDIFEPSAPVGLVMGTHSVNIFDPLVVDESGQYKLVAHMALMGFQKNGEDGSYDIDAEHLRAYVRNNGYLERGIYALMTAEENGHRLIGRLGGHGSPSTRTIDAERLYFRLKKDTDPRLRQLAEKDPSVAKRIGFYQGSLAVKPGIKFDIRRIYEGPGARRIDVHVTDLSEVKPSEPLAAVAREEIALKSARLVEIVATLRDLLGRIPGKQIKLSEEAGQEKLDRLFSEWDEINAQLDRLEGRIVEPSDSLKEFTKNYFLSGQADKPRSEMRSDEDEAFVEQMITQAVGYQLLGEPFTQQFQRHKEQTIGLISSLAGQVPSDVKSCVLAVRTLVENAFSLWAQSRGFEPIMRDGQAGNIHPQEFINKAITFPVFFNSDGKVTDLIQWVRDHYSHLDQYGVQVDILLQSANAVKADMSFYDDLRSKKEEWGKIEDVLNTCADHGISIPVLVIRRQGQGQKRVPMILTYGKNDYWGIYQATASPAGTREDRILIQSLAGRLEEQVRNKETFPNMVATLIHEIDHAIFEFIHSAGNRKLFDELFEVVQLHEKLETVRVNAVATEAVTLQKQMDDLKAKEEELRKTISMNQTFDRTGFVIVKEGLAMHSEGQFLEDQLNGLAERFAQTKGLEKTQVASAFQLLTAYDRALTHMLPGMILYAVGNVLIELFIRNGTPAEDFYLSNILESKIVKNRMLLLLFLKLLLQGQKPLAERISPDIAEAFTPEYIRSRIEERVGPQFNDLLMGREYQEMFDQIDELVAGMDRGRLLDLSGDAEADSLDVPEEALRNRVRKAMRDYAVDLKLRDMWKLILPAAAPVLQPQGASAETGALGRPEMRGENAEALVRGVVDALDPDPASRTVFNEAEVGQLSELLKLDFETVVRKIIELAEQRIGARKAQLGEGEKAAPSSAQSAVEQSQALLEWWKKRVESRKPLRGQVSLAVRLGNATAHDSFLKQLLKVLGEQERKATLFSDKASSKYVAKAIGAQGLRSWVSSIPLQAKDMTAGISELHRQDQPDVPIGLLEGTDSAQKMSDTFVGVALDEGEAPLDPDAVFHNELLFAIILGELMPDIISTEAYQEEVRAKVGRLLPPEKEKPEKIREIKAETLKAALLKLLEQIGYTSEIFSSQSAQFLTLNGAQIARMITEIRARAEIRKAA